jgi:hypothetical protein
MKNSGGDMSWQWHCFFINDVDIEELSRVIIDEVEKLTHGNLYYNKSSEGSYRLSQLSELLLILAEERNGWISGYGLSSKMISLIAERNKFSGALLFGEDDDWENEDSSENYWMYIIWESGKIVDTNIHNPKYLFINSSNDVIEKYIYPFMESNNFNIYKNANTSRLNKTFTKFPYILSGHPEKLKSRFPTISSIEEIERWMKMRTADAFAMSDKIFGIKSINIKYDPLAIATYKDTNLLSIESRLELFRIDKSIEYLNAMVVDIIEDITHFRFYPFSLKNLENIASLRESYENLFYW